ncbi:MAG: hypothetical protein IPJ13_14305 [Saprospiraceae bacterium]|nr:hypothetical protein [Saprospiraceae bacterium]
MKEELGNEWLEPELFRFGASSLLRDIEDNLSILSRADTQHHIGILWPSVILIIE